MISLLLSAVVTLGISNVADTVTSFNVYIGLTPHAYYDFVSFPATNRFALTNIPVGRVYFAASALSGIEESELSEEIAVQVFAGNVQLANTVSGPWTNYFQISVPIQIINTSKVVRIELKTQ